MKRHYLILALFLISGIVHAQEKFVWPTKKLDTARDVSYLSEDEKDIILELNMVRYNPQQYAEDFMKWMAPYYSKKLLKIPGKTILQTHEGKKAYYECLKYLKNADSAPILYPSKGLTKACELLVFDQGLTGGVGHRGSDNTSYSDRIKNFGTFSGYLAENIHYGNNEPRNIVILLLIDDGVHSRGHRKNIMNKELNQAGIAIGKHKVYQRMCVTDFASNFVEK